MKFGGALALTVFLAGATPLAAQMCGDDIAGLTVDDNGNYVMQKPGAAQPASPRPAMSAAPKSASAAAVSEKTELAIKQFLAQMPKQAPTGAPAGSVPSATAGSPGRSEHLRESRGAGVDRTGQVNRSGTFFLAHELTALQP